MHTRQNIFTCFSSKKAPAGKCTRGKNMFNDFRGFLESSPSTIQSSQTTMKSSQTTLESSQTTMESSQSRRADGIGQNRRKKSDYA